jgi:hypothetical protein
MTSSERKGESTVVQHLHAFFLTTRMRIVLSRRGRAVIYRGRRSRPCIMYRRRVLLAATPSIGLTICPHRVSLLKHVLGL